MSDLMPPPLRPIPMKPATPRIRCRSRTPSGSSAAGGRPGRGRAIVTLLLGVFSIGVVIYSIVCYAISS